MCAALSHGMSGSPLYQAWRAMHYRCRKQKCADYHRYGGRGIAVCEEWRLFEVFCEWAIKNGWRRGLQLDRIDNDGGYSPSNCRITTSLVNGRNRSTNRRMTAFGESKPISEWADDHRCAVKHWCLLQRFHRGQLSPEEMITRRSKKEVPRV